MRCLIDLTFIEENNPTGVSVVALRLFKEIEVCSLRSNLEILYLCHKDNQRYIERIFANNRIVVVEPICSELGLFYLIKACKYYNNLNVIIDSYGIDVFFIPYLSIWNIIPRCKKIVAILHDIQPLLKNGRLKNLLYKPLLKHKIDKCNQLVTISNYAKESIVNYFPSAESRICIIYNSVVVGNNEDEDVVLDKPYILNVNSFIESKNQFAIVRAFDLIRDIIPHKLIFKSKETDYWKNIVFPYIVQHKLVDRVNLIKENYSSSQLINLYKNADLFVNTSLLEGFGLTPIEAAINEVMVLTTDLTALQETTLGVLNYIKYPISDKVLSEQILSLINCPQSKEELKKISNIMKDQYSPSLQAKNYVILLKNL